MHHAEPPKQAWFNDQGVLTSCRARKPFSPAASTSPVVPATSARSSGGDGEQPVRIRRTRGGSARKLGRRRAAAAQRARHPACDGLVQRHRHACHGVARGIGHHGHERSERHPCRHRLRTPADRGQPPLGAVDGYCGRGSTNRGPCAGLYRGAAARAERPDRDAHRGDAIGVSNGGAPGHRGTTCGAPSDRHGQPPVCRSRAASPVRSTKPLLPWRCVRWVRSRVAVRTGSRAVKLADTATLPSVARSTTVPGATGVTPVETSPAASDTRTQALRPQESMVAPWAATVTVTPGIGEASMPETSRTANPVDAVLPV